MDISKKGFDYCKAKRRKALSNKQATLNLFGFRLNVGF